jgi:cysteine desulfuration protein SufE
VEIGELVEHFQFFDDWEDRYRYLIDLGKELPELPAELKTEETKVRGCTSQVWLVGERDGDVMRFRADSDSFIVRGLIVVLLTLYDRRTAAEVRATDVERVFRDIGLDTHLSPNRRNGFFSMVERIHALAAA